MLSKEQEFYKKSKEYEDSNQISLAIKELQKSISKNNSSFVENELKRLVTKLSIQKEKEFDLEDLIGKLKLSIPVEQINAAKKLAAMSVHEAFCKRILDGDHIKDITTRLESTGELVGELEILLVTVMYNISRVPHLALQLFEYVNSRPLLIANLFSALPNANDIKFNLIAGLIESFAANSENFQMEKVMVLLMPLLDSCASQIESIKLLAFRGLLKVSQNSEIATLILEKSDEILTMAKVDAQRSLSIAIFARIFSNYPSSDYGKVVEILHAKIQSISKTSSSNAVWALNAVFQANSTIGGLLLCKNSFLIDLLDDLEHESDSSVKIAVVDLLSSSFSLDVMKKNLGQSALPFLKSFSSQNEDYSLKVTAALALIKLSSPKEFQTSTNAAFTFVSALKSPSVKIEVKRKALEGLSYLSTISSVKELVVKDDVVFQSFKTILEDSSDLASRYAFLTILSNITLYPKELTKEQMELKRLHQMAKSVGAEDPLDDSTHVGSRIKELLKRNILVLVFKMYSSNRFNSNALISQISLAIATNQENRGSLISAGACRVLINIANNLKNDGLSAGQTLAKIAITSDPALAFKGDMCVEVVRPLVFLLENGGQLMKFEALMALTNLAGFSDAARNKIVLLKGLSLITELQFTNHTLIRRAATETICNMIYHPEVFLKLLDEKSQLLAITIALCDDDDQPTRRAASGLIAILSSEPMSAPIITKQKRFDEIFVGLLKSGDVELQHRAIEVVKNLKSAGHCNASLVAAGKMLISCSYDSIAQVAKTL